MNKNVHKIIREAIYDAKVSIEQKYYDLTGRRIDVDISVMEKNDPPF